MIRVFRSEEDEVEGGRTHGEVVLDDVVGTERGMTTARRQREREARPALQAAVDHLGADLA